MSLQTSIRSGSLGARWRSRLALAAALQALIIPSRGHADPVPPESSLQVFCFRITDIQRVVGDPGNDAFRFEFEALNWTHQEAFGVYITLNVATGLVLNAPRFAGAEIDMNGRPLTPLDVNGDGSINAADLEDANGNGLLDPGEDQNGNGRLDNDPIPGNVNPPNNWMVASSSATAIRWSAGTPIPSVDLLDFDFSGNGPLLPGDPEISFMQFGNLSDPSSIVIETIDNGPNAQDGFVLTVDDLDPGEIVSFNWFLLDQNGSIINNNQSELGDNPYAFGTVNLVSMAGPVPPSPVFSGNTGFSQSPLIFFDSVYFVPNPASFAAEFGAGLTGPFLDPNDNTVGAFANAQVLDRVILDPHTATTSVGAAHTVTATFLSGSGAPIAGQPIEFRVSGANAAAGQVTTNAAGEAAFSYTGSNAGSDTIMAWADNNGDGVQDPAEPFDVATTAWAVAGAPTCNGQPATIFVNAGTIVGGPLDGRPYLGRLRGGDGADVIVGTDAADFIRGGSGDDVICGGLGNDRIHGGKGDDDEPEGDEADDRPRRPDGNDHLEGGAGDDLLRGGTGDDLILGGDGNDRLKGGRGNDRLDGGAGDDRLLGENGSDTLTGGSGADRFRGGDGNDSATDFDPAEGDEETSVENL